ncbi:MAG: ATP-binding protein [Gammaproteobacteria bacterium]
MNLKKIKLLNSGFRQQLILTFGIGIIVMAILTSLALSKLSTHELRKRLLDEGSQTTETLTEQSTLALLYQSADNVRGVAEAILAYPDVIGIGIFNSKTEPLLTIGNKSEINRYYDVSSSKIKIIAETNTAWHFSGPVYANKSNSKDAHSPFEVTPNTPEILGYVHVAIGKKTLNQLSRNIYITNLSVSALLAIILVFVLSLLTTRITKPLNRLSSIMNRAEKGETNLQADLSGTKEIVKMATAFNTMMTVIAERQDQLNHARDKLEDRVKQRTKELAIINKELNQEIAERLLIEKQLINAKDEAQEASHAKSEFLSNMSHELRTPLNAIIGYSELLMEESDQYSTEDLIADCSKINRAGWHLLSLINEILDLARIESGHIEINFANADLITLLKESLAIIYPLADKRGVKIIENLDSLGIIELETDEIRLKEIMLNLLSNAVKYNSENGETQLTVEDQDDAVKIHVIDTGPGLTPDQIKEIFDPFNRLSAGNHIEGTGIGLTITKNLVEIMHGTIGIDSIPGKGSDFWIILPKHSIQNITTQLKR